MAGIPLLAPWADRLDEPAFYANGKRYPLGGKVARFDGAGLPIHGFLTLASDWKVLRVEATAREALVTSRLDFGAHPEWMAQFPFAHAIEMTYLLRDGVLDDQFCQLLALQVCVCVCAWCVGLRGIVSGHA